MVLRPYKQNHHLDEGSSLPARWTPLPPTRYRSYSPRWSQAHLAFTPLSLASVSPRVLGFLLLTDPLWFSIISNCQGLQENHVTQQFFFFFPLPLDLLGSDLCFTIKSVLDLWLKAAIWPFFSSILPTESLAGLFRPAPATVADQGVVLRCNKHDPIIMMSLGSNRTFCIWENATRWASL